MDIAFLIVAIAGVSYMAVMAIISYNPARFKNRFRRQLSPERLSQPFQSRKMQDVIENAGWNVSSKKINIFRFLAISGFLMVSYGSAILKNQDIGFWPIFISLIFMICTSSARFTPSGWVLRKLHQRNIIQKDGELIAFVKLYENNRMKRSGYVQLSSFCTQIAPHFEFIGKDLIILSERMIEDGLESAMDWFVSNYPRNHPFIHDIRTILITVESMDDYETVARHLKSQSAIISKISSDQYARRWNYIGDMATIFTSVPSILIFVMVISLVLLYVTIIKNNFSEINLIS